VSDDRARRLAQLRQAYESGILDGDTYQAAVAALKAESRAQAGVEGAGSIAQAGGVAAGARGVAVGHDVHGNVSVVNELPPQVLELFARQFGFDATTPSLASN
jgi:hypothetical protein